MEMDFSKTIVKLHLIGQLITEQTSFNAQFLDWVSQAKNIFRDFENRMPILKENLSNKNYQRYIRDVKDVTRGFYYLLCRFKNNIVRETFFADVLEADINSIMAEIDNLENLILPFVDGRAYEIE